MRKELSNLGDLGTRETQTSQVVTFLFMSEVAIYAVQ